MIVQTAVEAEPNFVMTMGEHTDFCLQMALAFGNDTFAKPKPEREVLWVIGNHDRGWDFYDTDPEIDPDTGLPYTMVRTPTPTAMKTNGGSPDFNTKFHPFCGLISSMHSWGLYNKRYGFSNFVIPMRAGVSIVVRPEYEAMKKQMLENELERQDALKQQLRLDPATQAWVDEKPLFQSYKMLQFFDTLALYFNAKGLPDRGTEVFVHVPLNGEEDATITMTRISDTEYTLDPYPFDDTLVVAARGRYMKPLAPGQRPDRAGQWLRETTADIQKYTLRAA